MNDAEIIDLGPHKGYCPRIVSQDDGWVKGYVAGLTRDIVVFEASRANARQVFCEAIDDYLQNCIDRGVLPETPITVIAP